MDTYSFIVHVKTKDFYQNIAEDVETRFDTSNQEKDRMLPTGKYKNFLGLTKKELGGQPMKKQLD